MVTIEWVKIISLSINTSTIALFGLCDWITSSNLALQMLSVIATVIDMLLSWDECELNLKYISKFEGGCSLCWNIDKCSYLFVTFEDKGVWNKIALR